MVSQIYGRLSAEPSSHMGQVMQSSSPHNPICTNFISIFLEGKGFHTDSVWRWGRSYQTEASRTVSTDTEHFLDLNCFGLRCSLDGYRFNNQRTPKRSHFEYGSKCLWTPNFPPLVEHHWWNIPLLARGLLLLEHHQKRSSVFRNCV